MRVFRAVLEARWEDLERSPRKNRAGRSGERGGSACGILRVLLGENAGAYGGSRGENRGGRDPRLSGARGGSERDAHAAA